MKFENMEIVIQRLKSSWPYLNLDKQQVSFWYGFIKSYSDEEVSDAVNLYCEEQTRQPTISDIITYVKRIRDQKRRKAEEQRLYNFDVHNERTVKCRNCNDVGHWWYIYPTGVETVMFCDCEAGRMEWNHKHDKEGQMPDNVFEYCFGFPRSQINGRKFTEKMAVKKNGTKIIYRSYE